MKSLVVGMTGASGAVFGVRLLYQGYGVLVAQLYAYLAGRHAVLCVLFHERLYLGRILPDPRRLCRRYRPYRVRLAVPVAVEPSQRPSGADLPN